MQEKTHLSQKNTFYIFFSFSTIKYEIRIKLNYVFGMKIEKKKFKSNNQQQQEEKKQMKFSHNFLV